MRKTAKKGLFYLVLLLILVGAIVAARGFFNTRTDSGSNSTNMGSATDQYLANVAPSSEKANTIVVGLSADYPPFEFKKQGELQGYDVDLAHAIGTELDTAVEFVDMDFSGLIPALTTNRIDMAVSGMTATDERKQNVDFSKIYFSVELDVISNKEQKLTSAKDLVGKRIGAQLGSTMEQYAKTISGATVVTLPTNHQLIQELKIGRIDAIICEHVQAVEFSKMNPTLHTSSLGTDASGYAIAFAKGSALLPKVNEALQRLEASKKLEALEKKWIYSAENADAVQDAIVEETADAEAAPEYE